MSNSNVELKLEKLVGEIAGKFELFATKQDHTNQTLLEIKAALAKVSTSYEQIAEKVNTNASEVVMIKIAQESHSSQVKDHEGRIDTIEKTIISAKSVMRFVWGAITFLGAGTLYTLIRIIFGT